MIYVVVVSVIYLSTNKHHCVYYDVGAVELRNEISRRIGCSVPGTLVFDYPTIHAITSYLHSELNTEETFVENSRCSSGNTTSDNGAMFLLPSSNLLASQQSSVALVAITDISSRLPTLASLDMPRSSSKVTTLTSNIQSLDIDAISTIPLDRWDAELVSLQSSQGKGWIAGRFGGFIHSSWSMFDNELFAISTAESIHMDPQHRVLLEDIGCLGVVSDISEKMTSVAVGIAKLGEPNLISMSAHQAAISGSSLVSTGRALSAAAGRVSFIFGLRGPCISIDTACSSSLVALSYVLSSIRDQGCTGGIASGLNLPMNWETTCMFAAAGMMSLDGRCKALDATADGYVRAEAAVSIKLDALSNRRDSLIDSSQPSTSLALLLAVAVNQDGRSSSLTAPHGPSQHAVIRSALHSAHATSSGSLWYSSIEMHGTGTALGDPIEIGAISSALFSKRGSNLSTKEMSDEPLTLGTAKSRYGHAETGAGLVGILNAICSMRNSCRLPTMHLKKLNPYIAESEQVQNARFAMSRQVAPSGREDCQGIAGASAFAFQGTNAHAILMPSSMTMLNHMSDCSICGTTADGSMQIHHKKYFWYCPPPHPLIGKVAVLTHKGNRSPMAFFDVRIDTLAPATSYLWHHVVATRCIVPGTAMVDVLFNAAKSLDGAVNWSHRSSLGLVIEDIVLVRPITLTYNMNKSTVNYWTSAIRVTCDIDKGILALQSVSATSKDKIHCQGRAAASLPSAKQSLGAIACDNDVISIAAAQHIIPVVNFVAPQNIEHSALAIIVSDNAPAPARLDSMLHLSIIHPAEIASSSSEASSTALVPSSMGCVSNAADCSRWSAYQWKHHAQQSMTSTGYCYAVGMVINNLQSKPLSILRNARDHSMKQRSTSRDMQYVTQYQASNSMPSVSLVAPCSPHATTIFVSNLHQQRTAFSILLRKSADTLDTSLLCLETLQSIQQQQEGAPPEISVSCIDGERGEDGGVSLSIEAMMKCASDEWKNSSLTIQVGSASSVCMVGKCIGQTETTHSAPALSTHTAGGILFRPRLLHGRPRENIPAITGQHSLPSTAIINGGTGSLGQLIASWILHSSTRSQGDIGCCKSIHPGIVMLGRSPHSLNVSSLPQSNASIDGMLTVIMANSAFKEDAQNHLCQLPSSLSLITLFHVSGVLSDCAIDHQTVLSMREVFAPKLGSIHCLYNSYTSSACVLKDLVLFSSMASLLGNAGQINYATANGSLDALSKRSSHQGMASCSVQWGPWSGGGMATASVAARFAAMGVGLIPPSAGLDALGTLILCANTWCQPLVAVCNVLDWSIVADLKIKSCQGMMSFLEEVSDSRIKTGGSSMDRQMPPLLLLDNVIDIVRTLTIEIVHQDSSASSHASMGDDDSLMSSGLDSLGAMELRSAINQRFSIELPATVAFDYPSIRALADHIVEQKRSSFASSRPAVTANVDHQRQVNRPESKNDTAELEREIMHRIASLVQSILLSNGADNDDDTRQSIGYDDPFMQSGLDSLGATEFRTALASAFDMEVELPATLAFDYPTVRALGTFITQHSKARKEIATLTPYGDRASSNVPLHVLSPSATERSRSTFFSCEFSSIYPTSACCITGSIHDALHDSRDVQGIVPAARWNVDEHYHPEVTPERMYVRFGAWLDAIDGFDSEFFKLSTRYCNCV